MRILGLNRVRQLRSFVRTYVAFLSMAGAYAPGMLGHCSEHYSALPFFLLHRASAAFRAFSERALAASSVGWYSA